MTDHMPMIVPDSFDSACRFAQAAQASGLYKVTEAQGLLKILTGSALGVPPTAALAGVHIVQGKPVLSSALIAALIKRSKRYDFRCGLSNSEVCEIRWFEVTNGEREEVGLSRFTIEEAKKAGLASKTTWQHFAEDMLFARALTRGQKRYAPDVFLGAVYAEGELDDPAPMRARAELIEEVKQLPPQKAKPAPAPKPKADRIEGEELEAALATVVRLGDDLESQESQAGLASWVTGVDTRGHTTRSEVESVMARVRHLLREEEEARTLAKQEEEAFEAEPQGAFPFPGSES